MIIYLMYEHIVREYDALVKLKQVLEKDGHEVSIYSIIFERNVYIRQGLKNPPDVIFVPWLHNEGNENLLYPIIKKNPMVRIVDFHHEELTIPGQEWYFVPKNDYQAKGIFHLAWGSYFKDFLIKNGVPENRIFVTGNFRTELLSKSSFTKKQLAEKYHLNIKKPWILFAETLGYYLLASPSERAIMLSFGYSEQHFENGIRNDKKGFAMVMRDLQSVSSDFYQKYEFIYRPHPGTHAPKGLPKWVHVISDLAISDWLGSTDLFLSRGSTSIFEAEAAGVPCLRYETPPIPPEKTVQGLEHYPQINSLHQITPELIAQRREQQKKKTYYQNYIGKADGKVNQRIASVVRHICQPGYDRKTMALAQRLEKPSVYFSIKNYLYEEVIRFMTATDLLEKVKYPHSAYAKINDIPYYHHK